MATYTGTMQEKSSVGKIWIAVVAFAVAAAIVIALAVMQGGSKAPSTPDRQHTLSRVNDTPTTGGSGKPITIPRRF